MFPASFWPKPLPRHPKIDEDSKLFVDALVAQLPVDPIEEKENRPSLTVGDFGAPIWYAGEGAGKQKIWLDRAAGKNPKLEEAIAEVPLPFGFRATGPFKREEIVGGVPTIVGRNGDNEAMLFDPSTDTYYEFFGLLQGGVDILRSKEEVEEGCETYAEPGYHCLYATVVRNYSESTGAADFSGAIGQGISGSGMHQAGGPIRIEEYERGRITHPVKIQCIGKASGESMINKIPRWPAPYSDGESPYEFAPQEGMIFHLPEASVLKPEDDFMRMVARAANEFGLILTDGSEKHINIFLECRKTLPNEEGYGVDAWYGPEDEWGTPGAILTKEPQELAEEFPWEDLEVVDRSYRTSSVQRGYLPTGVTT
jgi:hypothetical protein